MNSNQLNKYSLNYKGAIAIITLVYACLSLYLYNKYGVKTMNDSPRYLTYAENLSGGLYFDPLNFWYISYVFFVAFVKLFSESNTILIVSQYVLGYFAVLALFAAVKELTSNIKIAFLGAIVFTFFPDNLMWHSYVLTESFYCSILSITFYLLIKTTKEQKIWVYGLAGLFILLSFFSKPTSPAMLIALAFPFVWKWLKEPPWRGLKFTSIVVAGIILLVLANKMISSHRVMLIYENGDIIFAMHEFPTHPHHDWMTVEVPEDLYKPSVDQSLLQQMGMFVVSNPLYFMKLFFGKMVMYVTHIRTYWSWSHNLVVIATLWPLYFLSIRAIRKKLVSGYLATSSLVYFVTHTLVISGTWADWDGRFFVPIVPVVVVIGSIGLADVLKEKFNVGSKT